MGVVGWKVMFTKMEGTEKRLVWRCVIVVASAEVWDGVSWVAW